MVQSFLIIDPEVATQLDASQQTKVNEVPGVAGFLHLDVWLPWDSKHLEDE